MLRLLRRRQADVAADGVPLVGSEFWSVSRPTGGREYSDGALPHSGDHRRYDPTSAQSGDPSPNPVPHASAERAAGVVVASLASSTLLARAVARAVVALVVYISMASVGVTVRARPAPSPSADPLSRGPCPTPVSYSRLRPPGASNPSAWGGGGWAGFTCSPLR